MSSIPSTAHRMLSREHTAGSCPGQEAAWLSPTYPHFQPNSSCSAGASCSVLLLPSPLCLACRTASALVCHWGLRPVCQCTLAQNGMGE